MKQTRQFSVFLFVGVLLLTSGFSYTDMADEGKKWLSKVNAAADRVSRTALEAVSGDGETARSGFKIAMDQTIKRVQNQSGASDAFALAGMVLMLLGALAAVGFGFQLIYTAFGDGFGWGAAFLGRGFFIVSPLLGWEMMVVTLILDLLCLYFILTRWNEVRGPVVNQIFSVDFVLGGYLLVKFAG